MFYLHTYRRLSNNTVNFDHFAGCESNLFPACELEVSLAWAASRKLIRTMKSNR